MKNQKQKKEDKPAKTIFVHEQHTPKFIWETSHPSQNTVEPFRLLDSRWTMGRHKGLQLTETPTQYIEWALQTFTTMARTHRAILTNELTKR